MLLWSLPNNALITRSPIAIPIVNRKPISRMFNPCSFRKNGRKKLMRIPEVKKKKYPINKFVRFFVFTLFLSILGLK